MRQQRRERRKLQTCLNDLLDSIASSGWPFTECAESQRGPLQALSAPDASDGHESCDCRSCPRGRDPAGNRVQGRRMPGDTALAPHCQLYDVDAKRSVRERSLQRVQRPAGAGEPWPLDSGASYWDAHEE
jgi:hypothetical protein